MATILDAHASTQSKASSDRGPELQEDGGEASKVAAKNQLDQEAVESQPAGSEQEEELEEGEAEEDQAPPLPVGEEPPPLPAGEIPPPLPDEAPPDDGWDALWDDSHQAYYFYNRITRVTTWDNPRVPASSAAQAAEAQSPAPARVHGGYNPAIHGDYDPNADYAVEARAEEAAAAAALAGPTQGQQPAGPDYAATGAFNRFTGRWQSDDQNPDRHGDEAKSKRQMNAYFDVDAAANSHGGKSLKAERQSKKLSKSELKAFKEKRRGKKEEKRRAWLLD